MAKFLKICCCCLVAFILCFSLNSCVSRLFNRKESAVIQASADSNHNFKQGNSYDYPAMNLLDGEFLFPVGRTAVKTDTLDYVLYVAEDNTFQAFVQEGQTQPQFVRLMNFGKQSSATPFGKRSGQTVYFSGSFHSPSWSCWRLMLEFYMGTQEVYHAMCINDSVSFTMPHYDSYDSIVLYLYLGTYEDILNSNAFSYDMIFEPMLCSYDVPFTPAIETVYDSGYANGNETGFMRGALPLFQDQTIYTTIRDGAGRTLMTYARNLDYLGQSGAIDFCLLKQDIIQYAQDYNYDISTWYYTDLKLYFYMNGQSVGVADIEKIAVLPDSGYMSNVTLYTGADQDVSYNYQGTWVQDPDNTDLVHIEIPDDVTSDSYGAFSFTVSGGADNLNFSLYDGGSQYLLGYQAGLEHNISADELESAYSEGYLEGSYAGQQLGDTIGYERGYREGLNTKYSDLSPMAVVAEAVNSFLDIELFGTMKISTLLYIGFGVLLLGVLMKVFLGG